MMLLFALALAQDPAPVEEPALVREPVLVDFVEAPWPEGEPGDTARVLLYLEIDATGAVRGVEVAESGGAAFDAAAIEAARAFRFTPAEDASGPIAVVLPFEYRFQRVPDAPPPEVAAAVVNLDGTLLEMGTRRPLAGMVVRVEPAGMEAVTAADGSFAFRGVPPGPVTLRVNWPGYESVEQPVEVLSGQRTTIRLWMRNQSYGSAGIIGVYRVESEDVTRHSISMEEVRQVPGTFGDPVRVVQSLPGAARAPLGTGLLVIRGSNPEDSGVYVDGIRIPYIYHLGGFESVINPDLVAAVDYLPGGFGVEYGRSLGGVVDVSTTDTFPERTRVSVGSDLLDTGAMVIGTYGKQGRHGLGLAARRSYIDAILPVFLDEGFVVRPRWFDYQAKYARLGARDTFSVLVFGFEDELIASTPPGFSQSSDPDTQGDLGTTYGTHRVLVEWRHPFSDRLAFALIPAFGSDYARFQLGNSWNVEQSQWLIEARSELEWTPSDAVKLLGGVDFIGGVSPFRIELPFNPDQFAEVDPLAERDPFVLEDTQDGWGPDPYLELALRPLSDRDRLTLVPGIRATYVNIPGEIATFGVDPRFSARWAVAARTRLKGSVGVYHQPPQPFESYRPDGQPVNLEQERALAASVGWEQDVGPAIHGEVEAFWKGMSNLIVSNPQFQSLDDPFFTNDGVGRAYGVEVILRHDPVADFFGWISYTWSRSLRRDQPGDDWYPFDFDQPHILTALGGYDLPYDMEVSAKVQYVSGNPTTPYALGVYDIDQDVYQGFQTGAYNSERLPPYWAVSARFDKLFTFRAWQLDLYVDLLNLLHGTNPEFELYNYDFTEKTYLKGLPFIPSPGFEAKFEF